MDDKGFDRWVEKGIILNNIIRPASQYYSGFPDHENIYEYILRMNSFSHPKRHVMNDAKPGEAVSVCSPEEWERCDKPVYRYNRNGHIESEFQGVKTMKDFTLIVASEITQAQKEERSANALLHRELARLRAEPAHRKFKRKIYRQNKRVKQLRTALEEAGVNLDTTKSKLKEFLKSADPLYEDWKRKHRIMMRERSYAFEILDEEN
jgi:predicted RNase H-like nuclease (RuvC/YqgF family)